MCNRIRVYRMKETEEGKLKSEIEEIVKRINAIVKNIDELSPDKTKKTEDKSE